MRRTTPMVEELFRTFCGSRECRYVLDNPVLHDMRRAAAAMVDSLHVVAGVSGGVVLVKQRCDAACCCSTAFIIMHENRYRKDPVR